MRRNMVVGQPETLRGDKCLAHLLCVLAAHTDDGLGKRAVCVVRACQIACAHQKFAHDFAADKFEMLLE